MPLVWGVLLGPKLSEGKIHLAMQPLLIEFGISFLGSILAWLFTVKLGKTIADKPWKWHLRSFIAVFAIIFLGVFLFGKKLVAINEVPKPGSGKGQTPPQNPGGNPLPPVKPMPAATALATPEENFIRNYVAAGSKSVGPRGLWAVVLREGEQPAPPEITGAVVDALGAKGYKVTPIFQPAIFHDAGYTELYGATSALLQRLDQACDGIIVGEVKRIFSTDDPMQNPVTARMNLNLRIMKTKPGVVTVDLPISARGGGFSKETAGAQASSRAAEALKQTLSSQLP